MNENSDNNNTPDLLKAQYEKLANDWRGINQIIWEIPTAAITITSGIIIGAYHFLSGLPRIITLIIGSLLLISLTIESVKKRLLMDAIGLTLNKIEKDHTIIESPFSDSDPLDYINANYPEYYGKKDFVLSLFKRSRARQALTHVIFYAVIAVSALVMLEIIAQINHTDVNWVIIKLKDFAIQYVRMVKI